ncbi:putative Tic20 family protein [Thermocatellispora tengchongensis]|uniref:Putative Tic20 family protein n=1 Tax=Thermocatellispora tengchongensis TaxID=1073253 RepID=A0A840PD76_9ACTN|nr:DUF1707 and DUF4870 domain-containing protein [Thermocatellispora tengchongensis]MBB5135117.1 putative Tic20 family protein [Thermocatellispora tengchongensis]
MSNDDREQVVEHVKAAYAEGRFDKDEFDERVHRAMTAQTHADLVPIMQELYGVRPAAPAPVPPVGPRPGFGHVESGDRLAAGAAHLLPLLGLVVIGPLIVMLAGRASPYIRAHAVEALNFQLTVLGASILLPFTVIGLIVVPVIWVVAFVLSVVAGVSALTEGRFYRYPLTLRLVK